MPPDSLKKMKRATKCEAKETKTEKKEKRHKTGDGCEREMTREILF